MLKISDTVFIPEKEIEINAIRAQGSGGQNVNKVSSAIHLRFDIRASSLPPSFKEILLASTDKRINKEGVIVIKAQKYRTQEKNKDEAISRLQTLLKTAIKVQKKRIQTKPSKNSVQKRTDSKVQRGKIKNLRGKIDY